MTLLHLMSEGALAAAELLALVFVAPATAAEPVGMPAALERPVQLHRLSTSVDVRLLGSLADVRVAQRIRNDGDGVADLARALPAIDGTVDELRVVRGTEAVDLLATGDCGDESASGHARLSRDEAIADALQLARGAEAVIEVVTAQPLVRDGRVYRVALPLRLDAAAPHAMLVEQDDAWLLVVVPHRDAPRATLVLRPEYGAAETLALGRADTGTALIVPLGDRAHFDDLAAGVVELELGDGTATIWTTLVPDRVDGRGAVQARTAE